MLALRGAPPGAGSRAPFRIVGERHGEQAVAADVVHEEAHRGGERVDHDRAVGGERDRGGVRAGARRQQHEHRDVRRVRAAARHERRGVVAAVLDERDAAAAAQRADRTRQHHGPRLRRIEHRDEGAAARLGQPLAQAALETADGEAVEIGPRLERGEPAGQEQRLRPLGDEPVREVAHALRDLVGPAARVRRERLIRDGDDVLVRQRVAQELRPAHALPALRDDPDRPVRIHRPGHDRGRFFSGS